MDLDALIFGGGAAGLWTLDTLAARGARVALVETNALGAGQTVASQGIIHGGLKYTLSGLLTRDAQNIREMPAVWRECLAGERVPNLARTRVRAKHCYLWRTDSLGGRLGMIGAGVGLRVAPKALDQDRRPDLLRACPGTVSRLDEQVISPHSFLSDLRRRNLPRLLKVAPDGTRFETDGDRIDAVTLTADDGRELRLNPRTVVLAAGAGNAGLLNAAGRDAPAMQRRPLHMPMVRAFGLPELNGHCVDGAKTRVTVTSDRDAAGRTVWQVGGQVAEDGVGLSAAELTDHTARELRAAIPGLDLSGAEWATYRVDRAEADTGGRRPDDAQVVDAGGNLLACWPTKLALVPELTRRVVETVTGADDFTVDRPHADLPADWPRPDVAAPPWETARWADVALRRAA